MRVKLSLLLLLGSAVHMAAIVSPLGAQTSAIQATSNASSASPPSSNANSASQGRSPVVLPKDFSQLRVEPGDLLSVSVYDAPELSDAYRVDPAGELKLPLSQKVKVVGLTSAEVALLLEDHLKRDQILVNPQVVVDVQQFAGHFVTVLGEVRNPGQFSVIAPTKLDEIVAQAGGFTTVAGKHIEIHHGTEVGEPSASASPPASQIDPPGGSELVRPGDTVFVPHAGIIYVLGAVYHPGGFVMQQDGKLNVAQALALGGGTLLTAKTNGLRVLRGNPDGSVSDLRMSYDKIADGAQKPIELQAQDIVYVPMSKIKAVVTDATAILSAAASAAIYSVR